MAAIKIFTPHMLGVVGLVPLLYFATKNNLKISLILPVYIILFLVAIGLTPRRWVHATPTNDQNAATAIVFGFGYETDGAKLLPGAANQFLADWIVANRNAQTKTLLVQEGVLVALNPKTVSQLDIKRIHAHDPTVYVNTLEAAFCAIQELNGLNQKKALLVSHDVQLQRMVWDFERVGQRNCPDCVFLVPAIPNTPFPVNSVHLQTRNQFVYTILELLILRPRDLLTPLPSQCKAPATL